MTNQHTFLASFPCEAPARRVRSSSASQRFGCLEVRTLAAASRRPRPVSHAFLILIGLTLLLWAAAAEAAGSDYKLGPLDVVRVKAYEWRESRAEVFEWKPLNDQFSIGAEGRLSLPLVGEVDAAGYTTAELGQLIAERFRERMGFVEAPSVSVEIAKFRPFYITGDVHLPGEYPYRPGLTVLQALSLAGGYYRDSTMRRLEREPIAAKGELSLVNVDLIQSLAIRARLESEIQGATEVNFPDELKLYKGLPSLDQLLDQQRLVFETRKKGFETEVKALEDLCTYLRTDIDSIRKQIANQDKQVEIASRESEGLQVLAKKGLANVYRTLSVERNVAQLEGERLKVVNSLSRAQQELSKNELALIAVRNKRQNDLTTELSQTQAKIDALAQKYDMNERLLIEAELGVARQKSAPGKPGLSASYSIVRQAPTGPVSIDATEATPVEPGDTVKVTLPFPALSSGGRQLGRSSLPATVFPSTELGNAAVLPRSTTTE